MNIHEFLFRRHILNVVLWIFLSGIKNMSSQVSEQKHSEEHKFTEIVKQNVQIKRAFSWEIQNQPFISLR